jgi:hypothetical protein
MSLTPIAVALLLALQGGKVSIEGTVVSATGNQPIAGAQVTLIKTNAPVPGPGAAGTAQGVITTAVAGVLGTAGMGAVIVQGGASSNRPTTTTDNGGRFSFQDLDPGTYLIQAAADGYARQQFGLPTAGQNGMTAVVTAAAGQPANAVLHLTPAGNVSGRVTGANGEPLVGMDVTLLRANYSVGGRRNISQAGSAQTNDRGEYRLFWAPPGHYYLSVSSSNRPIGVGLLVGGASNNKYPKTFYPGVTDFAAATEIEVLPGGELGGMDFGLRQEPVFHVRGRLVDASSGQPPANASISITPREQLGGGTFSSSAPYNRADGTFQLNDVLPGSYWLRAQLPLTVRPQPGDTNGPPRPPSGALAIDVSGGDVENVILTIYPPVSITGRVRVDGLATLAFDRVRVSLQSSGSVSPSPPPQPATVNADGTFVIQNVLPGEYQLAVPNLGPAVAGVNAGQLLYLKDAKFGTIDLLSGTMSVAGPVSDQLQVVLGADASKLTGTVADSRQQPVPQSQIVLVPNLRDRRDLYKATRSDASGHFTLLVVPPGSYKIFAVDPQLMDSFYDPSVFAKLDSKGTPIDVGSSASSNVDLRLISPAQ